MTTPFVILATHRTGSTLLALSLWQHPDIACHGELMLPYRGLARPTPNWDDTIQGYDDWGVAIGGDTYVQQVFARPDKRARTTGPRGPSKRRV